MGLDKPIAEQFYDYITGIIFRFDFGRSYSTKSPVLDEIRTRLPISLKIAVFTLLWSIPVGVILGIISALKQYSKLDIGLTSGAMILAALPNFFSALLLMLLLSLTLKWLPASGMVSWKSYILPCLALGLRRVAVFTRMTRSTMLEVMRSDFVRTARAKGVKEKNVIWKHMLPNASIPVIAMLSTSFEVIIGGSAVIEGIFMIPGLGSYLINSINAGDYAAIQGTVLILSFIICVLNFITDMCYAFIDPRIMARYKSTGMKNKVERRIKKMVKEGAF